MNRFSRFSDFYKPMFEGSPWCVPKDDTPYPAQRKWAERCKYHPYPDLPQGWKMHIGCGVYDFETVFSYVLPYLQKNGIYHKMIDQRFKDQLDKSSTQRGKHIAIYFGDITPRMMLAAKNGNPREIQQACAEVRRVYLELDNILFGLIEKKLIQKTDYFSSDGNGGDKILGDSKSKMVGYRVGAYCTDFIVVINDKREYRIEKDKRELYKQVKYFSTVTLTVDRPKHRLEHRDRHDKHIEAQNSDHKRQCRIIFDFASRIYKKGYIMFPMGVMFVARPVAIGEKTIERYALQELSKMVVNIIDMPENAKLVGDSPRAAYYFYAGIILEHCTTLEKGLVEYLTNAVDQCKKHHGENGTFFQLKRVIRDILGVV